VVEDAHAGLEAARAAGSPALGLTTTHPAAELCAAVLAPDLTRVHLGRIEHDPSGSWRLEVLVVEAGAALGAARPFGQPHRRISSAHHSEG
jgi:hypothetical protein